MTINARNKGASGERELIKLLQRCVDNAGVTATLGRNLEQTRSGGVDIVGIDWLSGEIKRCEVLQLEKWWSKLLSLTTAEQTPVLFYRRNQEQWSVRCKVRIPLADGRWVTALGTVTLDAWLVWFHETLKVRGASKE